MTLSSNFLKKLKPEIVHLGGNIIVPSKALRYKKDPKTGKLVEKISPRTRKFENQLKGEMKKEIKGIKKFPTKKDVFVILNYGFCSRKEYQKCDLDNRAKTILDALKGPVYLDDSQVMLLLTYKELLKKARENYYRFSIKILNKKISTEFIKKVKRFQNKTEV